MYGKVKHVRQAGRQKDTGIWDGGGLEAPEWRRRRGGGGIGRGRTLCVKITKHIEKSLPSFRKHKWKNYLMSFEHSNCIVKILQLSNISVLICRKILSIFIVMPAGHAAMPYYYNIGHRMEGRWVRWCVSWPSLLPPPPCMEEESDYNPIIRGRTRAGGMEGKTWKGVYATRVT